MATTSDWESLRNAYMLILSKQGIHASIDGDGDIHFKRDGRNYYVTRNSDQGYFEVLFPSFWKIESPEELTRASMAAAKVTSTCPSVKVYVNSRLDNVSAEARAVTTSPAEADRFVGLAVEALGIAAQEFADEMTGKQINSAATGEQCWLEIHAEEGKFPTGRSFLSNMLGGSSLANWKFSGRVTGGGLQGYVEVYFGEFQTTYGIPMELMRGVDRKQAQDVLTGMHRMIIEDGWRQIESGPFWFSYRYVADSSILDKFEG